MNIRIVTFEKHRDKNLQELEKEYIKRLSKYCKVTVDSFKRAKIGNSEEKNKILEQEADLLIKKLTRTDFLVLLDAAGREMDSLALSEQLRQWHQKGAQALVFFIGGPLGMHPKLKQRANDTLSLSQLTFTHEMARMLLCEALYRSFDIVNNGNYHK